MNVLVVARHLCGGIRTYIDYNYRFLASLPCRLTVVATEGGEFEFLAGSLTAFKPVFVQASLRRPFWSLATTVGRLLRHGTFDLVHAQGLTSGIACLLSTRIRRIPLVVTHHDVLHDETFAGLPGQAKGQLLTELIRRFDCLVAVSNDSRENLYQLLPRLRQAGAIVRTIPNGVDAGRYAGLRTARADRREGSAFRLGFLGRFMPQKGFDVLVGALASLQEDPLTRDKVLVEAVNDGAFVREYRMVVSNLRLSDRFVFRGLSASVTAALANLDAVVIPSRWEACPLLPMEALVAGCPVIASDCVGLREVTEGSPAITASAGDSLSLANAIRRFIAEADALESAAADYASVAAERFDVRKKAAELGEALIEASRVRRR